MSNRVEEALKDMMKNAMFLTVEIDFIEVPNDSEGDVEFGKRMIIAQYDALFRMLMPMCGLDPALQVSGIVFEAMAKKHLGWNIKIKARYESNAETAE